MVRAWYGPKFWDMEANGQASGKNLYVLRYADVLLTLAEGNTGLKWLFLKRWLNVIFT
ncbi:RagB/SusD family nutrient uptake outer membrane protein [Parapedobacter sp. DT-150]|uniref:RagB/SusD family nutrient uptake outer membrane protein n=1 Tax=Parapedobacter sp. DT-150 TaxID=3396162 RepID=UPI003F1D3819